MYYFYSYLGNRLVLSFFLSVMVGLMDGFGLAMFIPLLQMVDPSAEPPPPQKVWATCLFCPDYSIKWVYHSIFSLYLLSS